MQESIIKDLYINYLENGEIPHKYHILFERVDTTTKELSKVMNKRNKKKLNRLCNDYEEIITIEADTAFKDGFSFAVKLMSEAYANK